MFSTFILVRDYPTHWDYCGSAFFVSSEGIFLTASHIFEKDNKVTIKAALNVDNLNEITPFEVLFVSQDLDIAVCKISVGNSCEYLEVAESMPIRGESLSCIGFSKVARKGARGAVVSSGCHFLGTVDSLTISSDGTKPFATKSFPAIITQPPAPEGFSGGPLLNSDGHVIGLHSATSNDVNILEAFGAENSVGVSIRPDALIWALNQVKEYSR